MGVPPPGVKWVVTATPEVYGSKRVITMQRKRLPFASVVRPFQRLVSWFMPDGHEAESPEAFKVQTIISASLLVGNSGFPFMLLFFYMQHPKEAVVVLWSWLFFMAIPFLARRGWSPGVLAHLLAGNYFQCHLFLLLIWGGVEAPNTMWFAAVPVVSVLVGSIAHGMIWSGIAALSVLGVYAVELFGWANLTSSLEPSEEVFVLAMGGAALLAAVFGSTTAFEVLRLSAFERRIRAERELVKANTELKTIDAQKTSFFQNVSHELRTPLTLILPPLEEAVQQRPEDGQMQMASRNARRLLRLVNQLLDLQKLRAGKSTLDPEPINVDQFLSICSDAFQSACANKSIDFSVRIDDATANAGERGAWILSDADALEKIVFNFLSNALKFTDSGGQIKLVSEAGLKSVRLSVHDTGKGIAAADLERLFKEFSQVDATATRDYEGTGLGLALVKSLANQLGGDVGVESALGEGSVFWIELPRTTEPEDPEAVSFSPREWLIDPVALADASPSADGTISGPETGPLVLVVDDLADLRALVAKFLHQAGYRTIQAANGREGLQRAREEQPELIVTDWMMPEMSGSELIEAVKADDTLRSVPVVLLTAKSDEESKLMGTQLGADAFLGKPFNAQELTSIVKNLLSLKAREREVESLNRMLTETVLKRYLSPDLVDRIVSGELSMDKPAEMRSVAILFSDLCGFTSASERLGPGPMSDLLNAYLSSMNDVIFKHGGTIDKFIGDAIMVLFGAPMSMSPEEQVRRACDCALEMQRAMEALQPMFAQQGLDTLMMRIGVHQGEAVVGNFGSEQRSDYTAIGPSVNFAARIESACTPGEVFVSESVRALLGDDRVSEAGEFDLKGIEGTKMLFSVRSAVDSDR